MARSSLLASRGTLALALAAAACGDGKAPPEAAKEDVAKATPPGKLGEPVKATPVQPPEPPAKADAPTGGGLPSVDDPEPPAAETAPPPEEKAAPDPAALLKEAKSRRTKDDRALAALAEAEQAGASPRDLAKAANARGLALHADPERAKKFFEWAGEKDPKYPDPMFNIAKQYAMTGDIPFIKEYLQKTKDRGGKKLLSQIEFDPTWQIVADDPEVRKLLK